MHLIYKYLAEVLNVLFPTSFRLVRIFTNTQWGRFFRAVASPRTHSMSSEKIQGEHSRRVSGNHCPIAPASSRAAGLEKSATTRQIKLILWETGNPLSHVLP